MNGMNVRAACGHKKNWPGFVGNLLRALLPVVFLLVSFSTVAQQDDYVTLPDRIKSNVFLKVEASATDCYIGEPIIVTYKLYSSMNSESVITRNPVFNGFEVEELQGGDAGQSSRETVDGVPFDVHVIKKLQLTPVRAGKLTIGALTMRNNVRLIDAHGNQDPILNGLQEGYSLNNGYYSLTISSLPISVNVAELPGSATRPSKFSGLVGNFKMNVQLPKMVYEPGEQGQLTLTIMGIGDFSKVRQPEIEWPREAELLPVKESMDAKADGSGYKAFTIPFVIKKEGTYTIPSIKFSFFDATSNQYKTITNIPIRFHVVREREVAADTAPAAPAERGDKDFDILWIGLALITGLLILFIWIRRSKNKGRHSRRGRDKNPPVAPVAVPAEAPSVENLLRAAADRIHHTGNSFYSALKQGLVQYFESRFALPAAIFNTDTLKRSLQDNRIPATRQAEILNLLAEIDMHIYSGGGLDADKENLMQRTKRILAAL